MGPLKKDLTRARGGEGVWGAPDSANHAERVGPVEKDLTLLLRARV